MSNKFLRIKSIIISFTLILSLIVSNMPIIFAEEEDRTIIIYHTNDMHGKVNSLYNGDELKQIGLDVIKNAKDTTKNSILIDAGDATQGAPIGKYGKGINIIELMNAAGYDGMTLGNHEFDYGRDAVMQIAKAAKFPVVSANTLYNGEVFLKDVNGNNGCNFIKEVAGKKIGFFGITTEETMRTTIPANLEGISFADEIQISKEQVKELKEQGVDLVIGVMHIGIDSSSKVTSKQIAEEVPGIDIIIDGHSHSIDTETVGNTLIQQTGTGATTLGRIAITFDGNNFSVKSDLIMPDQAGKIFQADEGLTKMYDELAAKIAPTLEKVVGRTETTLYGGSYNSKNVSRMVETNLGSLIGDAMIDSSKKLVEGTEYEEMPIVALENGGAVRSKISSGFINMEDILQVLPLDNRLSLQVINPNILYQTMERGVCKQNNPAKAGDAIDGFFGGYPQISGMRIEYDITKTPYDTDHPEKGEGERVTKIVLLNEDGTDKQELDRKDTTTKILFSCNDYTITEYPMVSDIPVEKKGDFLSDVLADYIYKLTIDNKGSFSYPLNQGRSKLSKNDSLFMPFDATITADLSGEILSLKQISVQIDNQEPQEMTTDENGIVIIKELSSGGHSIRIEYNGLSSDAYVDETVGLKEATIVLGTKEKKNIDSTINVISQIPRDVASEDAGLVEFARASYESLTDSQKSQVTNYDALVQAENVLNNTNNIANMITRSSSENQMVIVIIASAAGVIIIAVIVALIVKRKKNR